MQPTAFFIAAVLALAFCRQSPAQPFGATPCTEPEVVHTEPGHILGLETGWNNDQMAVKLERPPEQQFVNSYECISLRVKHPCGLRLENKQFVEADHYALNPQDPGVKVHEAVLLSAFVAGRTVRLVIQGCIYDLPKIIGVNIGEPIY
jgi:hypothetical protein